MSDKKYLWVEEYAPNSVEDCILPTSVKDSFLGYVKEKQFPNLILAGPAGVGKTSVARALCNEIDADLLFVNASLDRGIGDIRNTVAQFASCSSMYGGVKVVLLDEADNLTQDSQKALRALIEEFQNHCRFILTCNYPHKIIDAIHSRCTVFDFHIRGEKNIKKIGAQFGIRTAGILKENNIEFDPEVLMKYVMSMSPDWRGILNGLQGKTTKGVLEENILGETTDAVIEHIVAKRWTDVRDWMFKHSHLHPRQIERSLWSSVQKYAADSTSGKPTASICFGKYSKDISLGADPSITLLSLATELMMEVEWKN